MTTTDAERQITSWLEAMTLPEKVSLLAGANFWATPPVERLGVPALTVSDGPNGARGGGGLSGGTLTSACFPAGIALAATWNTALIERVGMALAEETRDKGAQMLLGPTVNLHRSPLNGRNFECYSEDPYLSAQIAVAYIKGLQREGVGATVKHFVCNDSEVERNTISSEVGERALRELYLPPFYAAIKQAGTWGLMSSYNRVNGTYAGEHAPLLHDLLKREWGFDGLLVSDWFGTHSTVAAIEAGLDLEMPGPPLWRGERLVAAVEAGAVSEGTIDEATRRVLRTILRTDAAAAVGHRPQSVDRPAHRALIRTTAAEGIVLLKNADTLLPLSASTLTSLAVLGPNARTAQIMGGGSAQVNMHYAVTPYDGIATALGDHLTPAYALGCTNHKVLPRLDVALLTPDESGAHGFAVTYYNTPDLSGAPVHHGATHSADQMWADEIAPGVATRAFSATLSATLTPRESGRHHLSLTSAGLSRLFIDGQEAIDNWEAQTPGDSYFGTGSSERVAAVDLVAGRAYALRIDYSNREARPLAGVRLGYLLPVADDAIEQAAALAARSEVAILCVGLNGDWETEGQDRPDMELPGAQVALIERVAAANPRTVVVLQSGSPVRMPWLDRVGAVIQAWYPGQECGNAIADVLFGTVNPSGRLPQTFPLRLADNPAYINYPGENGRVFYGEGIYIGYRYYDKKEVAPLFPFGFGLSYTTFSYTNLRLSASELTPDHTLSVSLEVTNTGTRSGQEVVQLYVGDPEARVSRPPKELKGFAKVALDPGATATVTLTLDREAFAYWDDARHAWVAEEGRFDLLIGSTSEDIRLRASVRLTATAVFGGPPQTRTVVGIDSPLAHWLADEGARALLERHLPGFTTGPQTQFFSMLSLSQTAQVAPGSLSSEQLQVLAVEVAALFADVEREP